MGFPIASKVIFRQELRELVPNLGVQRCEDARNLTSLRARRRSPGVLEQPPGNRRRKISVFSLCSNADRPGLAENCVEVCDVSRAPKSFRRNSGERSRFVTRLPHGWRRRTAQTAAKYAPPLPRNFHRSAERRSRRAHPCGTVWEAPVDCPRQRNSRTSLFSVPRCIAKLRRKASASGRHAKSVPVLCTAKYSANDRHA